MAAGTESERYEELREEVDSILQTINQALEDRDYLLGPKFSAADIAVSYYLKWASGENLLTQFEFLRRCLSRLSERPAASRAKVFL